MHLKKRLDRPFKRFAFIVFVASSLCFVGLIVLPTPFEIVNEMSWWMDTPSGQPATREITRVDTQCANEALGGGNAFARDYSIVMAEREGHSSPGSFASFFPLIDVERVKRGDFRIRETIEFTGEERERFEEASRTRVCFEGQCVAKLTREIFQTILRSCGQLVRQHQEVASRRIQWLIAENFYGNLPWSRNALLLTLGSLFLCFWYEATIARLIRWIRHG